MKNALDCLALLILGATALCVVIAITYILYLALGLLSVPLMGTIMAVSWAIARLHPGNMPPKPNPLQPSKD